MLGEETGIQREETDDLFPRVPLCRVMSLKRRPALSGWHITYRASAVQALVLGEESGIRRYSTAIAGEDMYILFASVLTMRPWDQVTNQRLDHLVMPDDPEERLKLQVSWYAQVCLSRLQRNYSNQAFQEFVCADECQSGSGVRFWRSSLERPIVIVCQPRTVSYLPKL